MQRGRRRRRHDLRAHSGARVIAAVHRERPRQGSFRSSWAMRFNYEASFWLWLQRRRRGGGVGGRDALHSTDNNEIAY